LPIHSPEKRTPSFRNPSAVYMKLCNFLRLDPSYHGKGLDAGARADEEVWREFAGDRTRLEQVANAIRALVARGERDIQSPTDDEDAAAEGRLLFRMHRARERNQEIVRRKKEQALAQMGRLACEVCEFDFEMAYGRELGAGFIECHHLQPLGELSAARVTRLSDLALICANCHRMIHRKPVPVTLTALKQARLDAAARSAATPS
jgi:5-methylcytosine-specific restriction enzyme A